MVCGFCPGSGSTAEKSFNRGDVFKRHLLAVHGVQQMPPNSRKKAIRNLDEGSINKKLVGYAPDATGNCSTCSLTFSNAQDFYEHLDDCVVRIVQQEDLDPPMAINATGLSEVHNNPDVHNTLERDRLSTPATVETDDGDDDMDEDMADDDLEATSDVKRAISPTSQSRGNTSNGVQKPRHLAPSHSGVPLSRKRRWDYPSSLGLDNGQMTMKKRVMGVFEGTRRLTKNDMMLSTEYMSRIKPTGLNGVTDLDEQKKKCDDDFVGPSTEEKDSDELTEEQGENMLKLATQGMVP